jgi:hypothetical protein
MIRNINNQNIITLKMLSYFALAIIFVACEGFQEEIVPVNVAVDNVENIVIINAEIEKDSTVWMQISYSLDIDTLPNTPIPYEENALVKLENGKGDTEYLTYIKNGLYYGNSIKGEVNEIYTLTVDINGRIYMATSTMLPEPGYQDAWVTTYNGGDSGKESGGKENVGITYYSDEWIVNDPSDSRNHYLFEWYTNGVHKVRRDWAIDDNRVVNANEGLRLFNVTMNPTANEYTVLRAAEIDKPTYNYFNMYEKIVRGLAGSSSQTPYNPASNFGDGTMGNFRAVEFSSVVLLTPPNIAVVGQNEQNVISFPSNKYFSKYNLYWSNSSGVTKENANVITDIDIILNTSDDKNNDSGKKDDGTGGKDDGNKETSINSVGFYIHSGLSNGTTYYYRIETEDAEGNVSVLSPEVAAMPDPNVPANGGDGNAPVNVSAISGTNPGEIIVSWDNVSASQAVYGIYWSTQPDINENISKDNQIWSDKGTDVSSPFTMSNLNSGTTYYFKVAVWDGKSVYLSEEVSATAS